MSVIEHLFSELRSLIADLTKHDGLISASVYDTARVLRLAQISADAQPALDWLLSQQQQDGGWGSLVAPRARDAPTLAALIALASRRDPRAKDASLAGQAFLASQAARWRSFSEDRMDDLPVAAELTIPTLAGEARGLGLPIAVEHYQPLERIGTERRKKLARLGASSRTPAAHCWETWGATPSADLVDERGGVGVSPAATAAFLRSSEGMPELARERGLALEYLRRAERSIGLGIPGVLPGIWPMERMEQQWALYALVCSDLLLHPALEDVVAAQIDDLQSALTPVGIGFSSFFVPDGDCTAVTLAILHAAGRQVDSSPLVRYGREDHFVTYPGERNFSYSTTVHAVHALALLGEDVSSMARFLAAQQTGGGFWPEDKWHTSRYYTTTHALLALSDLGYPETMRNGIDALLRSQRPDGAWGSSQDASRLETSYAVIALESLRKKGIEVDRIRAAERRARDWLLQRFEPLECDLPGMEKLWIGKEIYCPPRMDRPYELCATLLLALASASGEL